MEKRKGFTLVELIVVMAIIGILAAIAIPNYTQYVQKAKNTSIESNGATIQQAALTSIIEAISKGDTKTDAQLKTAINDILKPGLAIDDAATGAVAGKWAVVFTHTTGGTTPGTISKITVYGPSDLVYTGDGAVASAYVNERTIK